MENMPTLFNYQNQCIRMLDTNGEFWWVAADVCRILELDDVSKAVSRLDEDEKGTNIIRTPGGNQSLLCINESGLYSLIFTSRKPEAKAFKRWVTHEVLPSIRKYGSYPPPLPPVTRGHMLITPEQEKAIILHYVQHIWDVHHIATTANFLARSFAKRFTTSRAQQLLEELTREGKIEQFFTPHTARRGKFRPNQQLLKAGTQKALKRGKL